MVGISGDDERDRVDVEDPSESRELNVGSDAVCRSTRGEDDHVEAISLAE
jgi:hypothetical protein